MDNQNDRSQMAKGLDLHFAPLVLRGTDPVETGALGGATLDT
jgi:hypothetical protein